MTQNEKIMSYLKSGKKLNQKQAKGMFGISNLSARISELRDAGHFILFQDGDNKSGRGSGYCLL
jgi:hypothetical protein